MAATSPKLISPSTTAWSFSVTRRHGRSEEHTSELQSRLHLVCRLLLEKNRPAPTAAWEVSRPVDRLRRPWFLASENPDRAARGRSWRRRHPTGKKRSCQASRPACGESV